MISVLRSFVIAISNLTASNVANSCLKVFQAFTQHFAMV